MIDASIIIVTRNRKEMAARAIASAVAQEGSTEVIVVDDASTDGTAEFVREKFPGVTVIAEARHEGLIVQRSRAARGARGRVVFSIDDDAEYVDSGVVRQTLEFFDDRRLGRRVGAVMIPHQNCTREGKVMWSAPAAPNDGVIYATATFIGTAYAVRRDIFCQLGGFQDRLFQWGEESEYAQRLLDAGYFIVSGRRHAIRHYPVWTGKYSRSNLCYIYRNRFFSVWLNAPGRVLLPLLAFQVLHSIKMTITKPREPLVAIEGTLYGIGASIKWFRLRKPIRVGTYRLWYRLRKEKLTPLEKVVDLAGISV